MSLLRPGPHRERWQEIERSALRKHRRRLFPLVAAPVAVVVVVAVVVLAWPFSGGPLGRFCNARRPRSVTDPSSTRSSRAGGWKADRPRNGETTVVHGEEELGTTPSAVSTTSRHSPESFREIRSTPGRVSYLDKTLRSLAIDYRQALKNGTAVLGADTVEGNRSMDRVTQRRTWLMGSCMSGHTTSLSRRRR